MSRNADGMKYRGHRPARASGFTLIEMMAVLVLLAIMLAVAVPAFMVMGKGSRFDAATSELRATLIMARQWAITHRHPTYVVFASRPTKFSGLDTAEKEYVHTMLRGYSVLSDADGYLREWSFLPPGLAFVHPSLGSFSDVDATHSIFTDQGSVIQDNYVKKPFPLSGSDERNLAFIGFNPDGTTMSGKRKEVHISEAVLAVDESDGSWDIVYPDEENTPLYGVEVTPLTGGVRVKDYQL